MEATIYQRVKLVLEDKSISVNALSKQINVAQATLNPQLRGDRTLAANIVEKILTAFPDVSAEWLMRGVGTMYSNQDADDSSYMVAETPHREEPKIEVYQLVKFLRRMTLHLSKQDRSKSRFCNILILCLYP